MQAVPYRDSIVWIVENDFDVRRQHSTARSLVQQGLALLGSQMGELITEHELDGKEEITFAWTIPADDDIVPFVEWLDHRLFTVTLESLDNNLCEKCQNQYKNNRYFFGSK